MQVRTFLHKLLDTTIHQSRIESLIPVIQALITTKVMQLTQLGRNLNTGGKERSGIRRMDRLLGNVYYQQENAKIYEAIALTAIGAKKKPIILVDWTGLPNSQRKTNGGEQMALRATLGVEGRGITLYDEVHPKRKENNPTIHKAFLNRLKSLLPAECRPIIVTDAGFKIPWFKAILSLGWNYVGRVRGNTLCDAGNGFKSICNLYSVATNTAKSLGRVILAKSHNFVTNLYVCKHKLKGRKKLTNTGRVDTHKDSLKHSRSYREPWILASSLTGYSAAKKIVKIYKLRMAIEENIRDVKSEDFGFSMNRNQTIKAVRFIVWLMLSALASLIAWVVGFTAEKMGLHYDFQANTYRHRRVLSFFYLGCQVIRRNMDIPINLQIIQAEAWGQQI